MSLPERPARLLLEPAFAQRLTAEDGTPATFSWKAYLRFEDNGEQREVTDTCFWSIVGREGQQTLLGTIDRGRFTSGVMSAGVGKVRAEIQGLRAEVDLQLGLRASRLSRDDDGSNPPMDAATRFGSENPLKAPRLVYPPSGAVVPANLGTLTVQWQRQGATDLFEVRLSADLLDLRIYTTSQRRLSLSEEDLRLLTDLGQYGPVTLEVRGGNLTGDVGFGRSAPAVLRATSPIVGATYYFATARPGGAQGIWRHRWAQGGPATAFLTSDSGLTGRRCVGCHALSAEGGFLVVGHDQNQLHTGSFVDLRSGTLREVSNTLRWLFAAVGAGGGEAVLAGNGALTLVKTDAGQAGDMVPTGGAVRAVMPVLTGDGQRVIFVRGQQLAGQSEAHITGGSILVSEKQNGVFGQPSVLVAAAGADNNYYPALSPDGKWVVFNRVTGTGAAGDSYDNPAAALWAVPLDGSRPPLRLGQANDAYVAQNMSVRTSLSNSYPYFLATPVTMDGRQVFFLTFASRREYGIEITRLGATRTAGSTVVVNKSGPDANITGWNQQLWLTLFDPDKAAAGQDPTSAALWLPFQSPLSSNHTAVSTQTAVGDNLN